MFLLRTTVIPLLSFFFLETLVSCNGAIANDKFPDSDMYSFSSPVVINLPAELDEISGIAYYPKDTSLFAIIDEDGILFKIPIKNPSATRQWRFDKKRDYEDVVLIDSVFYVLVSNGDVEQIRFTGDSIHTLKLNFSDAKKSVNEYESLYLSDSGKIVMMCKECEEDKKKKISSFSFNNLDSNKVLAAGLVINMVDIEQKAKIDISKLKPSAAAFNPVTGDLYVISSINHLLLITDSNGTFKASYSLNPAFYKQPEGISFTPAGDLIISNESAQNGHATLLILKNKKKGR